MQKTREKEKGFTLVELAVVLVVLGVLAAIAIPNYITMTVRAKESRVKENCHCVQLAVELYATGTGGIYPDGTDAAIANDIVPLLPGQQKLKNPFTSNATEPVVGPAAQAGETGYEVENVAGVNIGYTITGFGKAQNVISLTTGQ
ncbi:MAG: prepilin-type N-terminal cleavage/methylation domain-containing protein [Candidatus Eisenbacteria bacterium]